jgi:hypothetical protein
VRKLYTNLGTAIFQYSHTVNKGVLRPSPVVSWHTVDLVIELCAKVTKSGGLTPGGQGSKVFSIHSKGHIEELRPQDFDNSEAFAFLVQALAASSSLQDGEKRAIKIVVPQSGGYMVRSDIVPFRCFRCEGAELLASFSKPLQFFPGTGDAEPHFETLPDLFNISVGGLLSRRVESHGSINDLLHSIDRELINRLSIPWLVPEKRSRRTVVMVGGESKPMVRRDFNNTARALGIDVVVIDKPGHWLEQPEYKDWTKAFIPADVKPDDTLTQTVLDAIAKYGKPIDGLTTYWDQVTHWTARAALRLGLPSSPLCVYETATDKYKTSQFAGHPSARASSLEEALSAMENTALEYPVIIKPCAGWTSEGVCRADSPSQLAAAVAAIDTSRHGSDFVMEPYIEGPELDINFVLCNGELLFFEGSDEFPKAGDVKANVTASAFLECGNIYPPALPPRELNILRDDIYALLLKLGARDGIFHLEARVKNSTMEYVTEDGICDLRPRATRPEADPSAWLIEINTRPSGVIGTALPAALYGVDLNAVSLCFAIDDKERARALATPFVNGAQCWGEMLMLPMYSGGIFDSDNPIEDVMRRRPDLAQYIEKPLSWWKRGDRVPDPSAGYNSWAAGCMVFSNKSRKHCISVGEEIRREAKWNLL